MSTPAQRGIMCALLLASALVSSVRSVEACSCVRSDPAAACELFKTVDVAFVGRAISVPPDSFGRVRFRLTQALKGVSGQEVTVLNSILCTYDFQEGAEYILFAGRNADGEIEVGLCSPIWRTHVGDWAAPEYRRESAEAVAFAASLHRPAAGGRIFGEVAVRVPFPTPHDEPTMPVGGATVVLEGPRQERRTSSADGRYEFTGLPRGTYTVRVTMPDGLPPARSARPPEHLLSQDAVLFDFERESVRRITIEDERGCGYAPFEAEFDGEIAGTVTRDDGRPVKGVTVEVFPAGRDPQRQEMSLAASMTDARGGYRIEKLPAGRYIVGINVRDELSEAVPYEATLYREPGSTAPSVIELGSSSQVHLGAIRLPPPIPTRRIAGTVAWSDGHPVGHVGVLVCEDRAGRVGEYCRSAEVSPGGAFTVVMFAGRTYKVMAEESFPPTGRSAVRLKLDGDVSGLRLILQKPQ